MYIIHESRIETGGIRGKGGTRKGEGRREGEDGQLHCLIVEKLLYGAHHYRNEYTSENLASKK